MTATIIILAILCLFLALIFLYQRQDNQYLHAQIKAQQDFIDELIAQRDADEGMCP